MPRSTPPPPRNSRLAATDRCVMCGMCLPHCPTYGKTRNEADSPRGRISLMQGLNSGQLAVDDHLLQHLDGCLTCRACESVCPSGVPYGELIDAARETLAPERPSGWRERLARPWIDSRRVRALSAGLLRLYQALGLQRVARRSGLLKMLGLARTEAYLPPIHPAPPDSGGEGPRVALFSGCVGETFDRETLASAVAVLGALGYRVETPGAQGCCGAIDQHAGRTERARQLMQHNLAAFGTGYEAIISSASGCGAMLAEYGRHGGDGGAEFAARVTDINRFVAEALEKQSIALRPLESRVAIHAPCSLTHVLKGADAPRRILESLPGLELIDLPDNARCCGAAGSYMLTQPRMADALREDKIAHLETLQPDILVTSNIGCALHLRAGIEAAGLDIEVIHPVTLLARQLDGANA